MIPFKDVKVKNTPAKDVYVSGNAVGIYMQTEGVLIIDTGEIRSESGKTQDPAYRPENSQKFANLTAFYQVKESYINIIFDLIENEYGGGERFLRKKLYLTAKATEELRKKYLI